MQLPFALNVDSARTAIADMALTETRDNFFSQCALEAIAQGVLTLSIQRGTNWTAVDLLVQIQEPREGFEASGLADGWAEKALFDLEPRQRQCVVETAEKLVWLNFRVEGLATAHEAPSTSLH